MVVDLRFARKRHSERYENRSNTEVDVWKKKMELMEYGEMVVEAK